MSPTRNTITLITGGSRSGKSSHALKLAEAFDKRLYIATAEAFDKEMKERIVNHQKERGEAYTTIEEPLKVSRVIKSEGSKFDIIILDCLTVWLGNLQHYLGNQEEQEAEFLSLRELLENPPCSIILVTNEVGMGIVPENEMSRKFRDAAGLLNQLIAEMADQVVLMVSGIPMIIKENRKG